MNASHIFTAARVVTPLLAAIAGPAAGESAETSGGIGVSQPVIDAGTALELMLGLVLVIGAIVVTAWLARRMLHLRPGMEGQLRILGGLSVGGRERVVLVQVGDRQLVLGVAPGRVQALHVMERPVATAGDAAAAGSTPAVPAFATVLRRFAGGRGEHR